MTREYTSDFDLTSYYGCDTLEDAAKLDKEMIDDGRLSYGEFADSDDVNVSVHVTREDTVHVA